MISGEYDSVSAGLRDGVSAGAVSGTGLSDEARLYGIAG